MKIINGKDIILGRLASYVAKEALRGEEISIINCDKIIITGNKRDIKSKFEQSKKRIGSGQQGPKISRDSEKIVKRAIRGMLPNHRFGRGKQAYNRIKCYKGIPEELKDKEQKVLKQQPKDKYIKISDLKNG